MMDFLTSNFVALAQGPAGYGRVSLAAGRGELLEQGTLNEAVSGRGDSAFETIRLALSLLGLDAAGAGSAGWNPLGDVIRPGDTVVLKPNFVRDFRETQPGDGDCLITHGSVIGAVLDYAFLALQGRGRLIVADAPQNDADFETIARIAGLGAIVERFARERSFRLEVLDLRPERAIKIDGVIVGHEPLAGDPAGYATVDLAGGSAFCEVERLCDRLYGAEYDVAEVRRHHRGGAHEYLISRTVLDADVVLSVPKLKTHKKVGLTVNLKNMVGVNGNKNWLPHHREGTPAQGGDQFDRNTLGARAEQAAVAGFKRVFPLFGAARPLIAGPIKSLGKRLFGDSNRGAIRSGNWHGNDTTWRMALDLNRAVLYADRDGKLRSSPQRRIFSIVDAIVAGEGAGPLDARPAPLGVILAGANPVAVDLACARLAGFDAQRMPMLGRALEPSALPLALFSAQDVAIRSNGEEFAGPLCRMRSAKTALEPHVGWIGHIELADAAKRPASSGGAR